MGQEVNAIELQRKIRLKHRRNLKVEMTDMQISVELEHTQTFKSLFQIKPFITRVERFSF